MTTDDVITLRPDGRLLVASLSRPPNNYISADTAAALRGLCASLREDSSSFDVLILTGHDAQSAGAGNTGGDGGAAFSRGTDPSLWASLRTSDLRTSVGNAASAHAAAALLDGYRCAGAVASLPFPVIAALNGDAHDQGLELALAADIRVAANSASFRMAQAAAGLIPWDGGTQRLPRCVGPANATDLILTGRTIDAAEAHAMGLVNHIAPDGGALAAAEEIAAQILRGGPIAARYAKEVVATGSEMTLDQGILLETDLTMILQTTRDRDEGIRAFLERRDPTYTGE